MEKEGKKKVLVIDDETVVTGYLAKSIERIGHEVFTAYTGEQGLELYKQNKPACVFLDIHLPEMDGMTVLKKIKEFDIGACVYCITGDADDRLRVQSQSLGAKGHILKPLSMEDVTKILREV